MSKEKIACLAGTPIDTKMGADKLIAQGFDVYQYPSSKNPDEEMLFQLSSIENKMAKIRVMLDEIKNNGIGKVFVYCNSLSSAIDFKLLSNETGLKIVTPFDVYEKEAMNYSRIGIIAANAVATSKIEKVLLDVNKDISIISIGALPFVWSVEKGISPKEIIAKHNLETLCSWFKENDAETLLLGCTHFPYFYGELQKVSKLPIINPSEKMVDLLL